MSERLNGTKVVIIGGTSGIGLAVATAASEHGASVVVASSNPSNVEAAVTALGKDASGSAVDVKDEQGVAAFFSQVGSFDHLVLTAGDWGVFVGGPLEDLDLSKASDMFGVRYWGALAAIKHSYRQIKEGGSITLTGGIVAHRPPKGAALGSAMAGGIEHLARALAVDLAPVRVNAVCPGPILTDLLKRAPADRLRRFIGPDQPLPRAGTPEEVAEAYLYLMRGGYTTGQVMLVDGGRSVV